MTDGEHDTAEDREHGAWERQVVLDEESCQEEAEARDEAYDDAARVGPADGVDDGDPRDDAGEDEEADLEGLVVEETNAHGRRERDQDRHEGAVDRTGEPHDGADAVGPSGDASLGGGMRVGVICGEGFSVHFHEASPATWGGALINPGATR